MKALRLGPVSLLASCMLAFVLGCTSTPAQSGFLGDYVGFEPDVRGMDLVWRKPGIDLSSYDKVVLDHVVVYMSRDADRGSIDPAELKQLADYFEAALVNALKDAYPVVDGPGPGVLRVRTAITDLKPGKPVAHAVSTVLPIALAASSVKAIATGTHLGVGEVTIEAELLDSTTNERLIAVVDKKVGRKIQVAKGVTEWGHVRAAFGYWAKRLRERLDEDRL